MSKRVYMSLFLLICLFIFVFMLYCNIKTPYITDDFLYMYDFSDSSGNSRIDSIWQIFPSMHAHRYQINGRVIAHFFVQLFCMLPKSLFNVVNFGIFVLEIILVFLCSTSLIDLEKRYFPKLVLFAAIFASVFIFLPMFGQVNFWISGAVNYLWGTVISVAYILFWIKLLYGSYSPNIITGFLFLLLSFTAGAYCENTSIAILTFSVLSIIFSLIIKCKPKHIIWASFFCAVIGFVFMISSPVERSIKISYDFSIYRLTSNFIEVLSHMNNFVWLFVVAIILFVMAFYYKADLASILIAIALFISAVVSCFCLVIASYIPPRVFSIAVVFLILCCSILFMALINRQPVFLISLCLVLLLFMPYNLAICFKDTGMTNTVFQKNLSIIDESRTSGSKEAKIYYVKSETKYSAIYGMDYLDSDPQSYPNTYLEKYFGIDSISIK